MNKFVSHGRETIRLAIQHGWFPGARYDDLSHARQFDRLGFLDCDWRKYNFGRHLAAAKATRPQMTVARDIERQTDLSQILHEANELSQYTDTVVLVPKALTLENDLEELLPPQYRLGYSVPTRHGATPLPPHAFRRSVHLLGGRPDVQRRLADQMKVLSFDCNRFALDAIYGDYFDGQTFRPHPDRPGYLGCIEASIVNINAMWQSYTKTASISPTEGLSDCAR
jgi:hypothetical protein